MENKVKWTPRMRDIVRIMRDKRAYIGEKRDAFRETSTYVLEAWRNSGGATEDVHQGITEAMINKLSPYLVEVRRPIYRHGKFITSQSVYYHPSDPTIADIRRFEEYDKASFTFPTKELPIELQVL